MTTEENQNYVSKPYSTTPNDWERIKRWAAAQNRSASAQIRTIVMPAVEAWERENGLLPIVEAK